MTNDLRLTFRREIFRKQLQNPLPMAFGGRAVVHGRIIHGEAVFDIGIDLDGMPHSGGLEGGFEAISFLGREVGIDAGDADVNFSAHFGGQEMGTVGLISG